MEKTAPHLFFHESVRIRTPASVAPGPTEFQRFQRNQRGINAARVVLRHITDDRVRDGLGSAD
jgi:hypothetical protein